MTSNEMSSNKGSRTLSGSNRRSLAQAITNALGISSGRRDAWAHVALALVCSVSTIEVDAAELPVPCVAGTCGSFFTSGHATTSVVGNTLNIQQTTNNATLNWAQFNISADGVVNFQQPSASATAINRIYQNDPSRIFGALNANGRVYLLNRNGVLFGNGAKVNVAGLVASSLDLTEDALRNGIAGAAAQGSPAFASYVEAGTTLASGDVRIEQGASISTSDGGQVLIFAPNIVNEGNISTPGGQTLLAAGSPVYLITSPDKNLRGLLVEVGVGGTVTNGNAAMNEGNTDPTKLVGQIVAERGNVTLAGLAVNQTGRVSATTTVREGGSIRLQARDGASVNAVVSPPQLSANNGGWLTLGPNSVTEVTLADAPDDVTVDVNEQPRSRVQLQGRDVMVLEDSRVTATAGDIAITARADPGLSSAALTPPTILGTTIDGSRIYVADGATLDVSGASVELDMEHNVVRAELRGDELANSPIQRDGALRGETVFVDVRQRGTRADGTPWAGTPIGDVSGQISLVNRDVRERNLNGGTVLLASQGDVIVAGGSTIDLSGGVARYRDGFINTTQLLGRDGRVYDIASADPNMVYVGTTSVYTVEHEHWGVIEKFRTFGDSGRFEQGYVEGKDAGELSILSPRSILDGDIVANVTRGRYQRQAAAQLAAGTTRPYDQLPLGAALILGRERETNSNDRVTGSVLFDEGWVLPSLRDPGVDPFDPEHNVLPRGFTTTRLRPEWFGENRIARAEIHANERVELPQNVSLQLPGQGELSVDAGQVQVDGRIFAPGGKIDLTAQITETTFAPDISFNVGSTAVLDVRGKWVNDTWPFSESGQPLAALLIDGGDVALSAEESSLNLAAGSSIDVSAGAWLRRDGSVVTGDGGSIELSASRDPLLTSAVSLNLGASLLGYALEHGGSLTLSAPEICVASAGDCGEDASEGLLTLRPDDLLAGGFGDLSLISNERGLTVAAGTSFELRQRNYVLGENALDGASGTPMDEIASRAVLPDYLRSAADLHLQVSLPTPSDSNSYNNELFDALGRLEIETGAQIRADAGANISLQSNTRILVDGTIDAPAGTIELRLDNTLAILEPITNQAIWLGANARLDVSGTTILRPDELGFRRGEVFDGGRIRFLAERGTVIANPGSQLDISGTSSTLDISTPGSSVTEAVATLIVSDGGLLDISAADGILLNGVIDAHAGAGSQSAMGGELRFALDSSLRDLPLFIDERRIVVTQNASSLAISSDALPDWLAGEARIAAEQIDAAGFDSVRLNARTTEGTNASNARLIVPGVIEFDGDVNLSLDRSLILEAAHITGTGDVHVTAPYVALGQSDAVYQETAVTGAAEAGRLQVSGNFIELLGHSTIDGFDSVLLNSEGDLRLRGVLQKNQSVVAGGLSTSADLTLRADQIYGSTLTDFTVALESNPEGVLRIESTGQERATVLSAGSYLTLAAPTIEQAGVLRAPFGTIELIADHVNLQAGSLTSTSAEGAIIPFGTTQAEKDWIYSLAANTRLVVGDTTTVPQQTVSLLGERVAIDNGAVIDVSGGGDLLTYEFMPGVTGKRDVLSALEEPGQFAIVPSLNIEHAPFDPQESADSTLEVGDSVHLSGSVAGLPAGDYVLLPARYALLKGAYLIKAAGGYADLRNGTSIAQLNGSTIVSGRHIIANTRFADAHTSGFEVRPGSAIAKLARYETRLASELLVAQAEENNTALPRLPQDAGVLAITAGAQLDINGSLRADAVEDGRGAAVDISAEQLRISEGEAGEGEVVVSADSLTRLGAESLLLGGRRSSTSDGTAIDVFAQSVTVDAGTSLSAPEILIAAADTVTVQSNAALTATGTVSTTDTYLVEGDSAVLRLAAGEQAEVRRNNEIGAAGTLILEQGARLTAINGALALDASLDTRSGATLSLTGGSLSLGASRINLGAAPDGVSGLTLSDAQLSGLNLDELVLVSRSTIDLYGAVALGVDDVSLDAAGIRGVTGSDGGSITATNSLLLTNRAGRTADDADNSFGTLALNAREIVVGEGEQRISGYDLVSLNASHSVRGEGDGELSVAGDLTLVTPVMVAATAANTTIEADGVLQARSPHGGVAGMQGAELGGRFELTGTTVDIATRVEAAAGLVSITSSTGDLTLSNGAWIDVAGRERDFDGILVAAPGGDVKLIADNGNVLTQAGSTIDVSAAGAGKAGSISVNAAAESISLAGGMNGRARASSDSGRFSADALGLGNLSVLNSALNGGGFFSELDLRQRGAGDLIVAAGDTVRAHEVSLTADQGSVLVNGVIDARGASGGDVTISAQDTVSLSGSILANATAATGDGGDVALRAVTGAALAGGSLIDVSAGADSDEAGGKVDLRVAREAVLSLTNGDSSDDALVLAGTIRGAERTRLEAFRVYDDASGVFTTPGVITTLMTQAQAGNVLYNDAVNFMASEGAILAALGRTGDASFSLLAGIELQTAGDLSFQTAGTAWNLAPWRFGSASAPGVLTLRAGGNLTINGSISDGFTSTTGTANATNPSYRLTQQADSWSYRLIAGADQGSADTMAVNAAVADPGDFTITAPVGSTPFHMVRTGNGSIEVAAAGDFVLRGKTSVLYTAGIASPVGVTSGTGGLGGRTYPIDGGDITIDARGDIKGAQTDQLVTAWLWRTGKAPDEDGWSTAWTVNFAEFKQGIAALGGGNVTISAGGDISNLSASIPSIGRQMKSLKSNDSVVEVIGGGDLNVLAEGNIAGGSFYVGRGTGSLVAGGDVTTARFSQTVEFDAYPVLALGDGQWNVTARGSAGIETIVNPTLLPQGLTQTGAGPGEANGSFFSTYTDASAVNIRAVAGDVKLSNDADLLASVLGSMRDQTDDRTKTALRIQPPTLRVASLSGDVTLSGETTLYPASDSTVELLAEGSVLRNEASPFVQLRQSDADPAALPTVESPHTNLDLVFQVLGGINPQVKSQHAAVPVHAGDDSVARIVARTGDVSFETDQNDSSSILSFSTPARVVAAGDIIDLPLSVQHDDTGDITSLVAGGDIRYVTTRSKEGGSLGGILRNSREINVHGPGLLQLAAGGEVDLQTSAGITTSGNVVNSNLPDGGASISVMAGASESDADYAALISRYFELDAGYETDLIGYVESVTGEADLTQEEAQTRFEQLTAYRNALIKYVADKSGRNDLTLDGALALFLGYTRSEQRNLMEHVAFSELRLSGRDAATTGSGDFTRGFTALQTLFPGSNPDTEAGETNPYAGDISLYFSRIYTLDGGDISLLTPGGQVNVGLASPPAAFGLVKGAAELGLVAQSRGSIRSLSYSDFAVEESRVFAADGGDILVWATDGDIDAGRGAKTAISAPAPTITFDDSGRAIVNFPAALTGSGIQTLASSKGMKPGNVDLFAPRGVVNAGDAGIVAGNLTIAATAVLGADNIQVSGVSVGTQVDPGALAPSLANVSAAASGAANSATNSIDGGRDQDKQTASLGDTALSWLEVFVVGLGEDNCGQSDIECLKRQKID